MNFEQNYEMTIDGKGVGSQRTIDVINPATGSVFAQAPACNAGQLDRAVEAARAAFPLWRKTPLSGRQAALRAAGEALMGVAEDMTRLFTREQGRPLDGARREIKGAARWFKAIAEMSPPVQVSEDSAKMFVETRYQPLGVVCGIAPWNFPVNLAIWKIAPALLAGNTMVLKPSPFTPLCALKMGELLRGIFPRGVLNIISGDDDLGPLMTRHPGFDKISFTGSTATGKKVLESAASSLRRVTLELGGNDAAIVFPDVDVEKIAVKIFFGAFFNSAQICIATKRLFVHEDIYDELRDRLVALAKSMKIGDGSVEGVVLGPLQNKRQYDRVRQLIADATANGLILHEGAAGPEGNGYFVPVTIVDNPPDDSRVVREEAFGPVLPMLKFSSVDEVVARANASEYGLAGAVWSKNIDQAMEVARRLETGTVWVNHNLELRADTPFAGQKTSGFGVENGMEGLLEYMTPQALYVAR